MLYTKDELTGMLQSDLEGQYFDFFGMNDLDSYMQKMGAEGSIYDEMSLRDYALDINPLWYLPCQEGILAVMVSYHRITGDIERIQEDFDHELSHYEIYDICEQSLIQVTYVDTWLVDE